jgi:hypothetical protein
MADAGPKLGPTEGKYFKLSDDQKMEVQDFLRAYLQGLQPGDKSTFDPIFSAVQKKYPELRLARSTFARIFGNIIESLKKDAGLPIRSERLSKEFLARANETFLHVLSSLPTSEKFESILFNELLELAHEHSPALELNNKKKGTLLSHFRLQDLKKEATLLRPHRTPAPPPEADEPAPESLGIDSTPANEGPCLAARRSHQRAADAERGGAAAAGLQSPSPAIDTGGNPFEFTGEYDYRRAVGGMCLEEDASVPLGEPPAPASVSDAAANVKGRCVGADGEGRASTELEAGATVTSCEEPAAVAALPATGEAAEAAADSVSRDSDAAEGPGGSASGAGSQPPIASAMDAPAPPASDSGSMEDVGAQAAQDEMQCDLGDLAAFAPCICCVENTSDKE